MKKILLFGATTILLLLLTAPGQILASGFGGIYDPSTWILSNSPTADGWVDTTGAPDEIVLYGSDNGSGVPGLTLYTHTAPVAGEVIFDWIYYTEDLPDWDQFEFYLNGVSTQLSTNDVHDLSVDGEQVGSFSRIVSAGDIFGFDIYTDDNYGDAVTKVTISNFSAPAPVPEPATMFLLGSGLIGLVGFRRKLRKKVV